MFTSGFSTPGKPFQGGLVAILRAPPCPNYDPRHDNTSRPECVALSVPRFRLTFLLENARTPAKLALGTPTVRRFGVRDTHMRDTHCGTTTRAVRAAQSAYHDPRMEDSAETFLWYDLETSGISPAHDRVVQFASQRTDAGLNAVEPPFSTYVELGPEVVPWPESLLVTGIAPQTLAAGLPEWEAMTEILRLFETPRTCVVGYNNLLFDDEFIRYSLYRNLLDPYAREWRDGNSRWDIIDLARAAGALRPEGIEWPVIEGKPSFALQAIAEANGLTHTNPHDALSDVHATIGVARLIRTRQPRLYQYGLSLRSKDAARRMLVPFGREVCIHSARSFGSARYGTAPVLSIAQHPEIDASIIVADLGRDVSALIEGSAEDLADALFAKEAEERPPLHQVRLNRLPVPRAPERTATEGGRTHRCRSGSGARAPGRARGNTRSRQQDRPGLRPTPR